MSVATEKTPCLTATGSSRSYGTLSTFAALLHKELHESRAVIIVGLWSFLLMPICIELLYILYGIVADRKGDIATGVAWGALVFVGWLYAIVVGAHVVCRDWGKPEEHFLTSRPVSARSIVTSKLMAGLIVILFVATVAALWDLGVALFDETISYKTGPIGRFSEHIAAVSMATVILSVMTVGFLTAFAAAVVSRQMLTSVLVGMLVLLIWWVSPKLSRDFEFLYPTWWHDDFVGLHWFIDHPQTLLTGFMLLMGRVYLLIVAGVGISCIATALIAAPRECTIRVGHKTLAWAMAVVVLVMFGFAMNEVGTSLNMCDHVRLFETGIAMNLYSRKSLMHNTLFARQGEHCVIISTGIKTASLTSKENPILTMPMVSFQLDDAGKVCNLRRTDFLDAQGPTPAPWLSDLRQLTIDEAGDYYLTGFSRRSPLVKHQNLVCRLHIRWPADREPELVSQAVVGLPEAKQQGLLLTSFESTNRWAYLVYATATKGPDGCYDWASHNTQSWPRVLYVYDWSNVTQAEPHYKIPIGRGYDVRIVKGKLAIYKNNWQGYGIQEVYLLDPNEPKTLAMITDDPSALRQRSQCSPLYYEIWGTLQSETSSWPKNLAYDEHCGVVFISERNKVIVRRQPPAIHNSIKWYYNDWPEIGEYRVSPIAMMFRQWHQYLKLHDDNLLTELTSSTLTTYDVSEPERPRPVGFFHLAYNQDGSAKVFATDRHFLLLEGHHLTVLDRPLQAIIK